MTSPRIEIEDRGATMDIYVKDKPVFSLNRKQAMEYIDKLKANGVPYGRRNAKLKKLAIMNQAERKAYLKNFRSKRDGCD